jgi:hypothetical protein
MQAGFHPDFGAVNYSVRALPESSDGQVRSTIKQVIDYVREDARSPFIQEEARKMLALGSGDPNLGCWSLLKPVMQFRRDEATAQQVQGDADTESKKPDIIEVLIRPIDQWLLIRMRGLGLGDCDCWSMYGACLLTAIGVPCALATVSADEERPNEFSHVYLVSYANGQRTALDISHGERLGWECPNLGRIKEWRVWETAGDRLLDAALVLGGLGALWLAARFLEKETL